MRQFKITVFEPPLNSNVDFFCWGEDQQDAICELNKTTLKYGFKYDIINTVEVPKFSFISWVKSLFKK